MRKRMFFATLLAAMTITASAQDGFSGNKLTDNWYVGVIVGGSTKTTKQNLFENLNSNFGARIGKWLTPVVGVGLEGNVMFSNKTDGFRVTNTIVNVSQINALAQFNLSNWISGYPGDPRPFEVVANIGLGWGHNFGTVTETLGMGTNLNTLNNKLAVDLNYNFGKKKQWQLYAEPSITYCIAGVKMDKYQLGIPSVGYDVDYSFLQFNIGLNYKFLTSNGKHNFAFVTPCDETLIDELNRTIGKMKDDADGDAKEIAKLQKEVSALRDALAACEEKPVVVEETQEAEPDYPNLIPVFYQCNKSVITASQIKSIVVAADALKKYPDLKVVIKGFASPEGPHGNNDSLSVRRSSAVKKMLVEKYGIDPSRIDTEGCGETDKLFEQFHMNRVAMLYLTK